uniref:Uncharacterized protein n=1 Tax=Lepeophtheirus salmonis TaxID=72036 RepID=A0A0K2U4N8_LEPSM
MNVGEKISNSLRHVSTKTTISGSPLVFK